MNDFILSYTNFTDEELNSFNKLCKINTFKRGSKMFEKDIETTSMYFLTKGIVKYYLINHNGQEVIYNFRQENMIISSYTYYNKNIAKYNVECLEDCKAILIPIEAVTYLLQILQMGKLV
jgi:CRP-like cAMP-binding protein